MTTAIVYSEEFSKHNDPNHPENAKRLQVMMDEVKKTPFYKFLDFIKPDMLPDKTLYDVHSEQMIEQIKGMSLEGGSWIDMDTYVSQSDFETAKLAAGGLLKLCNNILKGEIENGFALIRPPGHHATKDRSMGFCLFNNAAIAANEITKQGKKVLIFDFDVHHGNGTQDIFYDRKDVLYQSIHLSPHYPGTGSTNEIGVGEGKGYTINAPLSYGKGDKAVTKILDEVFIPIAEQFKPDFIIISSGFDSHHQDPLGGLRFTANFYGEMTKRYMDVQSKLACTPEGGYNLNWIGKCLVSQLAQLSNNTIKIDDSAHEDENVRALIKKLKEEIGEYWDI